MVRITRVYTRTGDGGETALGGGLRLPKHSLRIEAIGQVDELNCALGWVRALLSSPEAPPPAEWQQRLERALERVQQRLFDLGAALATPRAAPAGEPLSPAGASSPPAERIRAEDVRLLETWMDAMNLHLPPLTSFVLPAGGTAGAALHLARGICRRAERHCSALAAQQAGALEPAALPFLNRLSDALFVCARYAAQQSGQPETLWQQSTALTSFWD